MSETSESWKLKGNVEIKRGNNSAAVDCYSKSLSIDPKNIASLNNRALAYLNLKQ
jgi:tetratricopeptide (TPR) repeat protein